MAVHCFWIRKQVLNELEHFFSFGLIFNLWRFLNFSVASKCPSSLQRIRAIKNEWNHVYCFRGPVDCVIHTDDVLHEKKNLETMLQTVQLFPRRLVGWAFFPACGACAVALSVFLVCLGTAKIKTAVLEFFVALSFKFHLLKKYK